MFPIRGDALRGGKKPFFTRKKVFPLPTMFLFVMIAAAIEVIQGAEKLLAKQEACHFVGESQF